MSDNLQKDLEDFAVVVARRADDIYKNASLASARMKAVLACLLADGICEFLKRGASADMIRDAIQRASGE